MSSKVDPPDPVARGGDDVDDNDRPMRWVSVTPATAKRDSSVKLGKVRGIYNYSCFLAVVMFCV